MRQSDFCGGLGKTLHLYDTVENLQHNTSRHVVSKLLRRIGEDPSSISSFDRLFPRQNQNLKVKQHNTFADTAFDEYYSKVKPEHIVALKAHYQSDYDLFQIS